MIINYELTMPDIKMLMIENLVTGQLTNFSPMTVEKCMLLIQNQEKVNNRIGNLFENVSSSERYVFNNNSQQPVNDMQVFQISSIESGLSYKASQSIEFADHGSDYVDLLIVQEAYKTLQDKLMLSSDGQSILNRYNIKLEQLDAFDSDELLSSIKNNQDNKSVGYVTQKTNTFLVHAISDLKPTCFDAFNTGQTLDVLKLIAEQAIPTLNSPLNGQAMATNKVQIARSMSPELCCSSFNNGDGPLTGNNFGFSQIGLIISNGMITHAHDKDHSSTVDDFGSRNERQHFNTSQHHVEHIFGSRKNHANYNEILVKNPEFAGVYLNLDYRNNIFTNTLDIPFKDHYHPLAILDTYQKMKELSIDNEKPLPILAIHNGQVRELSFNISALKEYLPRGILNDINDHLNNTKRYDSSVPFNHLSDADSDEFLIKIRKFNQYSSGDILEKFFILGEPLTQKQLHDIGKEHQISQTRKIEIIQANSNIIKGNLADHKINEIKSTLSNSEFSINFSVFENLKVENNNNHAPLMEQRKNKIR